MQVDLLRSVLSTYAAALETSGAAARAGHLRALASALALPATGLAQKCATLKIPAKADKTPKLGALAIQLAALMQLLGAAKANREVLAALKLLIDVLHKHSESSLKEFESALKEGVVSASAGKPERRPAPVDRSLVDSYLRRLETALGDDAEFRPLFHELSADKRVTRLEAVEIATRFLGPTPASTSRPKALQRVRYRHEKLMESRAASRSIGGRSAA